MSDSKKSIWRKLNDEIEKGNKDIPGPLDKGLKAYDGALKIGAGAINIPIKAIGAGIGTAKIVTKDNPKLHAMNNPEPVEPAKIDTPGTTQTETSSQHTSDN